MVAQSSSPYNLFFPKSDTFSKQTNETIASRFQAASVNRPSDNEFFSDSSACGIHTASSRPPTRKRDCRFHRLNRLRSPADRDEPGDPAPAQPFQPHR